MNTLPIPKQDKMVTPKRLQWEAANALHPIQLMGEFYQKPYVYSSQEQGWGDNITVAR